MTLLFADSFDHYTTMPNAKGWVPPVLPLAQDGCLIAAYGRNGTNGFHAPKLYVGESHPIPSAPQTLIVGAAVRFAPLPSTSQATVLSLSDGTTMQASLMVSNLGEILAWGGGSVRGRSGIGTIAPGAYNYLELLATIDNAAGSLVVRLNGSVVISLSGIDTQVSANAWANYLTLAGQSNDFGTADFDDLYVCDTLGVRNNGFLGDVRVQACTPVGPGNYTQWDGLVGAATHWQAQADNPPNSDTTYVSDTLAAPGHLDTYAMADLVPTSGTVAAVQVSAWARKDDAGTRTVATVVRSAGVDAAGAAVSVPTTYGYVTQVYETDPGGAPWTIATANAAEAGVKAVA